MSPRLESCAKALAVNRADLPLFTVGYTEVVANENLVTQRCQSRLLNLQAAGTQMSSLLSTCK